MAAITTFEHPSLGPICGKAGDGLTQFLGLKYASLRDRLAEPEMITEAHEKAINATKIGPQALSPPNACDFEYRFIQQRLPHGDFTLSDRDCLHLNITVPHGATNLPVMVFIHGGGFAMGSNAWPQYDQSSLVKLAIDVGLPFIGVTVNYRLGAPGFLTSKALQAAGYKSNNGLRDQQTALRWVKKNIAGFGGDPDMVTAAGQSAGAVATMHHLQSPEPLFSQLLAMSGSTLVLSPLPPPVSELAFGLSMKALGLENLSEAEQVQSVSHGPGEALWAKITPDIPILPVIDDSIVRPGPTFAALSGVPSQVRQRLPGSDWCSRIMIGDCGFDGSIYRGVFEGRKSGIADTFHKSLTASFSGSPSTVRDIEETYSIRADTSDEIALQNILKWITDIGFYAPAVALARCWPGQSYLYHLNEPNPWDGPDKSEATHIMDVTLLFQNFSQHLSESQQELGKKWAEDVIRFVHGKDPFPSCQSSPDGAMVYGPGLASTGFVRANEPVKFGRRATIQKLGAEVGLDALNEALGNFVVGR